MIIIGTRCRRSSRDGAIDLRDGQTTRENRRHAPVVDSTATDRGSERSQKFSLLEREKHDRVDQITGSLRAGGSTAAAASTQQ